MEGSSRRSSEPGWTVPSLDDTVAARIRFPVGWEASRRSNCVGLLRVVQIVPTSASLPGHGWTGKTMTPSERVEGELVSPRGRRGLSPPDARQRCAHAPPPQGGRKRSRNILAVEDPKCWSAFGQKVLQGEATFVSISGGEGAGGNGSALSGGCSEFSCREGFTWLLGTARKSARWHQCRCVGRGQEGQLNLPQRCPAEMLRSLSPRSGDILTPVVSVLETVPRCS